MKSKFTIGLKSLALPALRTVAKNRLYCEKTVEWLEQTNNKRISNDVANAFDEWLRLEMPRELRKNEPKISNLYYSRPRR